jgi:hypothetical protein
MERDVAVQIAKYLDQIFFAFNELTLLSDKLPTAEDGKEMRKHLGAILNEADDLLRSVLKEYPELNPDK